MKERIRVLVTAVGGGGHGEQILKALLLAEDPRVEIHAADMEAMSPQLRLVEKSHVLPSASDPAYLDRVLHVCRENDIDALFHGCEPELKVFSTNRDRIREAGLFLPINPPGVIETCMDKVRTSQFLEEAGFTPPRWRRCRSKADLEEIDFFPVVIKPSVGSGGSANCFIAQDAGEMRALGDYLHLEDAPQEFIVQEYVGTPECEFTVGVLRDMDGNFLNSIAIRRQLAGSLGVRLRVVNRTGNEAFGPNLVISSGISQGEVGRFPEVTGPCEEITEALGARGAINIQCRLLGGKVKVFEINPRFSGTTSLRAMVGYNEPGVLLGRHLLGDAVEPRFPYRNTVIARSLTETELPAAS